VRSAILSFGFLILACVLPPAGAWGGTYEFQKLWGRLGYSDEFFGATEDELTSLRSYIEKFDSFFSEINGYLRFYPKTYTWYGTGPKEAREEVRHIDAIFKRAPGLPADLVVYRGLTLEWRANRPFGVGEQFVEKAYSSTSTNREVALSFARPSADSPDDGEDEEHPGKKGAAQALLVIYFRSAHPRGLLINQGEDEVILPHGTLFRVMDRDLRADPPRYLVQACEEGVCDWRSNRADVLALWRQERVSR
jgi:hypothetical protein